MRQRGFTLIEVLIVVAIVITVAAVAFGMTAGAQPMAMRSSVTQFDAALAYGRAIAATSGNGATLVFTPRQPSGFSIAVYYGRPTAAGALQPAGIAPLLADGNVSEGTLGVPPFALFLDSAGHASMAPSNEPTPVPTSGEPSCPPAGEWRLAFKDARTIGRPDTRALTCPESAAGPSG